MGDPGPRVAVRPQASVPGGGRGIWLQRRGAEPGAWQARAACRPGPGEAMRLPS